MKQKLNSAYGQILTLLVWTFIREFVFLFVDGISDISIILEISQTILPILMPPGSPDLAVGDDLLFCKIEIIFYGFRIFRCD